MLIEGFPSWIGAAALFVLYLIAVVNVGLMFEDTKRRGQTRDLRPIPVEADDRRR